jgi:hypothetical protein
MSKDLLTLIEEHLAETGRSPHRFGFLAAKNFRLVERLRQGKPVLTTTDASVRSYIAAERKKLHKSEQAA